MTINSRMTVDIRGRIASLTLCRPDRGNAIDHAFGAELLDAAITLSTTSYLHSSSSPRDRLTLASTDATPCTSSSI